MADDHTQRPFRSADASARPAPERAAAGGSDPLAELARLIGQNDPFGEFGRPPAADPRAAAPPEQGAYDHYAATSAPGAVPMAGEPFGGTPYAQPGYDAPPMAVHDQSAYADHGYDPAAHPEMHPDLDPNTAPYGAEEVDFYDDVPPRRRMGILAIAAVFALAVLGTAGAVGYRALFDSSSAGPPPVIKADTKPSKIVPASKDVQSTKLIQDRVTDKAANEKLVSREEQPVAMNKPAGVFPQTQGGAASSGSVQPPALGSGVIASDPKKVRTIVIRPDGMAAAAGAAAAMPMPTPATSAPPPRVTNVTPARQGSEPEQIASTRSAAPPPVQQAPARSAPPPQPRAAAAPVQRNVPLSLSPGAEQAPAPAPQPQTAPVAPTRLAPQAGSTASSSAGGYAVQVSSRRSEADAQAAFRSLQSKFPGQLGGRQPLIRRVDLGDKGIYYRTMVGPFGSPDEAKQLCEQLKAAGGSCFVQRI